MQQVLIDAVVHSRRHAERGGLPFVGVVVTADGFVSAPGVNRVVETGDPTAHAEIVAMRQVMAARGRDALTGATLLATGEPCTLCYRFAADHGIGRVGYAVDQDTAAAWGFDYRGGVDELTPIQRELVERAEYRPVPQRLEPFRAYSRLRGLRPPTSGSSAL